MKRIWIVCLSLALILSCGIAEHYYILNTFDTFVEKLEEIDNYLDSEDYETALEKTHELQNWWDEKHALLENIAYSPDMRQIDAVLGEIEGSLDTDDNKNAESKIDSLYELLHNVRDILDFHFKDIF